MIKSTIKNIVLSVIDEKIGKKYPIIDEVTDVFQDQEKRFKKIERKIAKLEKVVNPKEKKVSKKK